MMKMNNPIGWFEIPVLDLDRAENFYKELFGFKLERQKMKINDITMSFFPMDMETYGAGGTLALGPAFTPSHNGVLVYFPTESIDAILKKAGDMGRKILMPRAELGGNHGFIAWIEDTEGNRIAVHSMKE